MTMSQDRDRAFARLSIALDDQSRLLATNGASGKLRTRAAAEQSAAREAWLAWMERGRPRSRAPSAGRRSPTAPAG